MHKTKFKHGHCLKKMRLTLMDDSSRDSEESTKQSSNTCLEIQ